MNQSGLVSDAIKIAEALATAYVNGSASTTLEPVTANVAGKQFSLTIAVSVSAK